MTLAEITALINAKIRNKTPKVLKVEHADVEQEIANIIFSETIKEDILSQTITSAFANILYSLTFKKIGNLVFVTGNITNIAPPRDNFSAVSITDAEFYAKTDYPTTVNGIDNDGNFTRILFETNKITIKTTLGYLKATFINGFYFTND